MTLRLATTTRTAMADAALALLDAGPGPGEIRIYSGGQPANPQATATGTLLATVVLADPASGSAVAGVDTITDPVQVNPVASGTAGWARLVDSTGAAVMDCAVTVTGGGGEIQLSSVALNTGTAVDMAALPFTVPES